MSKLKQPTEKVTSPTRPWSAVTVKATSPSPARNKLFISRRDSRTSPWDARNAALRRRRAWTKAATEVAVLEAVVETVVPWHATTAREKATCRVIALRLAVSVLAAAAVVAVETVVPWLATTAREKVTSRVIVPRLAVVAAVAVEEAVAVAVEEAAVVAEEDVVTVAVTVIKKPVELILT
jgi:hypothetical protein